MRVLVVGGGGREHALAWCFSRTATVFCAPGNPGTSQIATNLALDPQNAAAVRDAIRQHHIDLTVIGPEAPLAAGLSDFLAANGHHVFGPSARAARIETSKAYSKKLMQQAGVSTAESRTFTDKAEALAYVQTHSEPMVVKAFGLAAGKGVMVCETRADAATAVQQLLDGRFGDASSTILIEDFLVGEELSIFAITDGEQYVLLPPSQDHKRLLEQDRGPNTGGMGAYTPVGIGSDELLGRIAREIITPTLQALAQDDSKFVGFLYAGLMIAPDGAPSVIEFNCRFGDPEAQVVLPALDTDLLEHLGPITEGGRWQPTHDIIPASRAAVTTVLAAPGYPDAPKKGASIELPASPLSKDMLLFHAGTRLTEDGLVTAGGRVLCATGLGESVPEAAATSRGLAELIRFEDKVYRRDIAWREILRAGVA